MQPHIQVEAIREDFQTHRSLLNVSFRVDEEQIVEAYVAGDQPLCSG